MTRGFILQEIFRRVEPDQKTIGQYLQEKVFQPLGVNIQIGVDEEDQKKKSISNVIGYSPEQVVCKAKEAGRLDVLNHLKKFNEYSKETEGRRLDSTPPFEGMTDAFDLRFWNSVEARRAEMPSAGALASARGMAVTAGHLASGGGDLLSQETWRKMHDKATEGFTFGQKTFFTQGGVNYFKDGYDPSNPDHVSDDDDDDFPMYAQLVPAGVYGWGGFGGSVYLWDPVREVSLAYVPTYLAWYDREKRRGVKCLRALYKCL